MILDSLHTTFTDLFARDNRLRILRCGLTPRPSSGTCCLGSPNSSPVQGLVLLAYSTRRRTTAALWLKWAAEMGPAAGQKAIIWLPYARDEIGEAAGDGTRLEPLREYLYSGLTWQIEGKPPTLFAFLKEARRALADKPRRAGRALARRAGVTVWPSTCAPTWDVTPRSGWPRPSPWG